MVTNIILPRNKDQEIPCDGFPAYNDVAEDFFVWDSISNLCEMPYDRIEKLFLGIYKKQDDDAYLLNVQPLMTPKDLSAREINSRNSKTLHEHTNLRQLSRFMRMVAQSKYFAENGRHMTGEEVESLEGQGYISGIFHKDDLSQELVEEMKRIGVPKEKIITDVHRSIDDLTQSSFVSSEYHDRLARLSEILPKEGFGYMLLHNHPDTPLNIDETLRQQFRQAYEQSGYRKKNLSLDSYIDRFIQKVRMKPSPEDLRAIYAFSPDHLGIIANSGNRTITHEERGEHIPNPENYLGFIAQAKGYDKVNIRNSTDSDRIFLRKNTERLYGLLKDFDK
jgi:hypothetical protein